MKCVLLWQYIKNVISLAPCNNWQVYQLDVKSDFLHGELMEDVYVDQPIGYVKGGRENVYKLPFMALGMDI